MRQVGRRSFWRFPRAVEGSNAVEFALLLPVFLLLVLAMIGYGLYLGAAHSLASLAAEGARGSIAGLDAAERRALSRDLVVRIAADHPLLHPGRLSVETIETRSTFSVVVSYDLGNVPIWDLGLSHIFPSQRIVRSASTELVSF